MIKNRPGKTILELGKQKKTVRIIYMKMTYLFLAYFLSACGPNVKFDQNISDTTENDLSLIEICNPFSIAILSSTTFSIPSVDLTA